jgi:hypothetical protein
MAAFGSTADVHRIVGDFFRQVARSREGASVAGSGLVAAFVFNSPQARVVLDGRTDPPKGEHFVVHVGNHGPTADVTFSMAADDAERVFTGRVPIVLALANGTIRARGAVGRAMPLVPAVKKWVPLYVAWRRTHE